MIEFIAIIILISSLVGMGIILFRKIPLLVELPEVLPPKGESVSSKLRKKIKEFNPLKNFSYEVFLQKILSKIRILSLRSESKIGSWLQKLREKSQRKKENDNYWEEIKKIKTEK